ncbi:MAG: M48 family metallopeptidase [Polaromonas sp.]|uniref:M48 family metallopeptidase n=1 Tax=Polaromonas sp. TaxID=1869339 RepID=UPI0027338026|nr:M48 family metallopeptidase [Polaromonas sp.]MDP2818753.1 M48 family metallopeptidase [Polaromonas sp.]
MTRAQACRKMRRPACAGTFGSGCYSSTSKTNHSSSRDGRFQLLRTIIESVGREGAQQAFETFFQIKGLPRIAARVAHFASRAGVAPGKVQVKDLAYRWAAYLPNGDLQLHWKCLMAPLTVIDSVVVHALCHMGHRDHSEAFWNAVDKVLQNYRERKEWLRQRGANLEL